MDKPVETQSAIRDPSQFLSSSQREESRVQPLPPLPVPTTSPVPTPHPDSPCSPQDWSKNTTTPQPPTTSTPARQNQVSHVMLHGILIVSLNIDNKERLCLAQISNTLLKDYSYNEIHNRRVALGITCVQCTPVQLEILRRAGAMPVSSRRCGMITKREAERLVKSFLEDTEPPKLPEDFAFQVYHECGWGCHGYFEPARYNSSRAKCIKCGYCSVYFSPNKFIFHFHRVADAKYHHPDAANFNSWRRHLKLAGGVNDDEIHLWEDVKAMFNGGTRKRIFSSAPRTSSSSSRSESSTSSSSEAKKKAPKLPGQGSDMQVAPKHPFPTHTFNPYTWGYGPTAKPSYPFVSVNTSQSLCFGFPPPPGGAKDNVPSDNGLLKSGMTPLPAPWLGRSALPFSNLDAFWDKAFGLPRPLGNAGAAFRGGGMYPPPVPKSPGGGGTGPGGGGHLGEGLSEDGRQEGECGERERREPTVSSLDLSREPHPPHLPGNDTHNGNNAGGIHTDRLSAFRPVGRNSSHAIDLEDDLASTGSAGDADETEEIDVMEEDCASPQDLSQPELREAQPEGGEGKRREEGEEEEGLDGEGDREEARCEDQDSDGDEPPEKRQRLCQDDVIEPEVHQDAIDYSNEDQRQQAAEEERDEVDREQRAPPGADDSGLSDESEADGDNEDSSFLTMTKEELCHSLKKEVCNRKKKEKEVSMLRETFQEEVTREKAFRDQMARQLEVLRETLTNELEQERKVRFSLQQKLKEAHDALHSFSCSMLTAARDGCGFKDTVLPR